MQCKEALVIIQTHNFSFPHHQCRWQWLHRSGVTPVGETSIRQVSALPSLISDTAGKPPTPCSMQNVTADMTQVQRLLMGRQSENFNTSYTQGHRTNLLQSFSKQLHISYASRLPFCICCKNYDQIN